MSTPRPKSYPNLSLSNQTEFFWLLFSPSAASVKKVRCWSVVDNCLHKAKTVSYSMLVGTFGPHCVIKTPPPHTHALIIRSPSLPLPPVGAERLVALWVSWMSHIGKLPSLKHFSNDFPSSRADHR